MRASRHNYVVSDQHSCYQAGKRHCSSCIRNAHIARYCTACPCGVRDLHSRHSPPSLNRNTVLHCVVCAIRILDVARHCTLCLRGVCDSGDSSVAGGALCAASSDWVACTAACSSRVPFPQISSANPTRNLDSLVV